MLMQNQSGSSRSTSTTVHPAASSWSCMCAARSTSGPMSRWLSATAVRGVDGSWTIRASSPAWSRTEHQSCSSGERRIRHSTRPWVVTSGGDVVTGRDATARSGALRLMRSPAKDRAENRWSKPRGRPRHRLWFAVWVACRLVRRHRRLPPNGAVDAETRRVGFFHPRNRTGRVVRDELVCEVVAGFKGSSQHVLAGVRVAVR